MIKKKKNVRLGAATSGAMLSGILGLPKWARADRIIRSTIKSPRKMLESTTWKARAGSAAIGPVALSVPSLRGLSVDFRALANAVSLAALELQKNLNGKFHVISSLLRFLLPSHKVVPEAAR